MGSYHSEEVAALRNQTRLLREGFPLVRVIVATSTLPRDMARRFSFSVQKLANPTTSDEEIPPLPCDRSCAEQSVASHTQ